MQLLTDEIRARLLANGERFAADSDFDPLPVVKLFTPDAGATWLLASLDPEEPDIAFGLCDLGLGYAELGTVRISEIADVRGAIGLPVERDDPRRSRSITPTTLNCNGFPACQTQASCRILRAVEEDRRPYRPQLDAHRSARSCPTRCATGCYVRLRACAATCRVRIRRGPPCGMTGVEPTLWAYG